MFVKSFSSSISPHYSGSATFFCNSLLLRFQRSTYLFLFHRSRGSISSSVAIHYTRWIYLYTSPVKRLSPTLFSCTLYSFHLSSHHPRLDKTPRLFARQLFHPLRRHFTPAVHLTQPRWLPPTIDWENRGSILIHFQKGNLHRKTSVKSVERGRIPANKKGESLANQRIVSPRTIRRITQRLRLYTTYSKSFEIDFIKKTDLKTNYGKRFCFTFGRGPLSIRIFVRRYSVARKYRLTGTLSDNLIVTHSPGWLHIVETLDFPSGKLRKTTIKSEPPPSGEVFFITPKAGPPVSTPGQYCHVTGTTYRAVRISGAVIFSKTDRGRFRFFFSFLLDTSRKTRRFVIPSTW